MEVGNHPITAKEAQMRHSNQRPLSRAGELPAAAVPAGRRPAVHRRPHRGGHRAGLAAVTGWLDRIFSPLVTLWVFLGQVLSADHSCRAAVARLIAHRLAQGQRPCSAETGAYCQARQRLPESFFADVARQSGGAWKPTCGPQLAVERSARLLCSMARRSRCRTPRRTKKPIRKSTIRSRASASRSRGSGPSSPWRVGRS